MTELTEWEFEVTTATLFIISTLQKSKHGYFALELVDMNNISRDAIDEAISRMIKANMITSSENHRMVLV